MLKPRFKISTAIFIVMLTTLSPSGIAHHGIGDFDHDREISITGVMTKLRFVNPHSWVYLDVTNAEGVVEPWQCELRSANILKRSGWSKDMFVMGETVSIKGSPARRKNQACYTTTITFANGKSYDRYAQIGKDEPLIVEEQPVHLANGVPNINGDWAGEQYVLTDPSGISGAFVPLSVAEAIRSGERSADEFRDFPGTRGNADLGFNTQGTQNNLTEAGQAAIEDFIPARDNPRFNCKPSSIIFDWNFDAEVNRIIQTEETITLLYGFMDLERTIHMNMHSHPDNITPSRAGHSTGRWEGEVLIVDTIGFEPGIISARNTRESALPHSDLLHVTEKFYLNEDRSALIREYTAMDTAYLKQAHTGRDKLLRADYPYEKPQCEDVYFTEIE